jgi:Rrf2 family iron-sulfur cluster assembly transcriptional regulator
VADIIYAVDEPLDATQCGGKQNCKDDDVCMTHELWAALSRHMVDFLDSVNLQDLVSEQRDKQQAREKEHSVHARPDLKPMEVVFKD